VTTKRPLASRRPNSLAVGTGLPEASFMEVF
jgi:hypothetical protein